MILLYVLVIVLLVAVALYVASCYLFASLTLNPKRQPVVASPADVGLEYEEIEFLSRDGLRLKGWFLPGDPGRVLVVTHPMYCNRHGFLVRNKSVFMATRTDIDLLPSFRALNQAGYSVLTFDFRNHGASDSGQTGVGLNEYQDVLGALDYLQSRDDLAGAEIGLVGFCMGANAAIIALSREPVRSSQARCLVAIQPISMAVFVRSYIRNTYTRLGLIVLPLMELIRRRQGGHPLEDMSPRSFVKDLSLPILFVQGRHDPWTELSDIEGIHESASAPKKFWWLEDTRSRPEAYNHVGLHPKPMIDFLDTHMS